MIFNEIYKFIINKDIIIGVVIGAIVGFVIAFYYAYICRIWLRMKPKYKTFLYDADSDEFYTGKIEKRNIFRMVIKKDKLTDCITIRFTNYYMPNGKSISLRNTFKFHYFDECYKENKYWIELYKEENFKAFIDEISFISRDIGEATTTLKNLIEILGIKN